MRDIHMTITVIWSVCFSERIRRMSKQEQSFRGEIGKGSGEHSMVLKPKAPGSLDLGMDLFKIHHLNLEKIAHKGHCEHDILFALAVSG